MHPALRHRLPARAGAALLLLALVFPTVLRGESQDERWVAAWATSIQPPAPGISGPAVEGFAGHTLRLILRPAIGGGRLRLRICNTYGQVPLALGDVRLAERISGSEIRPQSGRIVTFAGSSAAGVPPGGSILSDPVSVGLRPGVDLAVDLYLPTPSGPPSWHFEANRTSYISLPGDHAGEIRWDAAKPSLSWFYLCGLDVIAPRRTHAVVAFGDSLTDGALSTTDAAADWPSVLARRVAAAGRSDVAVINAGISGNRLLEAGTGESALARFGRDALAIPGIATVILLEGGNDIGRAPPLATPAVCAAAVIDGYRQLIRRAHAAGLRIVAGTLTPMGGNTYYGTAAKQAAREIVNGWLRRTAGTPQGFDAVIDFDGVLRDPARPERLRPAYDSGDHLHPNDTGYRAMAEAVDLDLL